MTAVDAKSRQQLVLDLLCHALRVKDAALNAHAAEMFRRLEAGTVRRLVLEALCRKNSPAHRLRVLAVLERVGELSCMEDWLDLNILAADKNPKIRQAAGRCLVRHSPAPAEACG